MTLLANAGGRVESLGDDRLTVIGLATERVADLAAAEGSRCTSLTPARASLEDVFPGDDAMTRALRAEWTKLRTIHSTGWALGLALVLMVLLSALAGAESETSGCPASGCDDGVVANALGGVYFGQFAVIALGVMAMGSEYATGLIRVTFVAEPRRRLVMVAKALTVGGAVLIVGLLASVLMFEIASSLLEGNELQCRDRLPR